MKEVLTSNLDQRQLLIVKMIAQGLTREQIAEKIGLSVKTVEFHISGTENPKAIYKVLGLNSVADITHFAIQNKLISSGNGTAKSPEKLAAPSIQTTHELAQALLRGASMASSGQCDVLQINALVQCSDAIIRLARLQMDAGNMNSHVPWLESKTVQAQRNET